ncbi:MULTISPECIES: alpha/beta hydrolase [unclassified Nocardioides]|uniref:alpha/beta hydrolase n=1 Tax=unclassified Nocardioides TaxID=2615069 RepID=UPI0006FCB168|nr:MULTISPECIES: alpha/beta hydrolase [unclassified Nocardioides]KRA28057.1 acetyl xylan esterase [Nocardioides sp. Root614]KRA86032.1 acetyl xylan esterase [Nocardioides sp. Root682]
MTRENIEFQGEGDVTLRGWFYPAENATAPAPAVVMTHGMTAVKELYLDDYAEYFAAAGLNVVVYDHRNYGESDGLPRQETDPVLQHRDIRNAISYASTRPEVDAARIGVWGTSFAGGHALIVAAIDKRVKAVVSQVPFVSGSRSFGAQVRADHASHVRDQFNGDRLNRFVGGEPALLPAITEDPAGQAMMPAPDAYEWFSKGSATRAPNWKNEVTARSLEWASEYEPGSYISRISPTPLLMLVADNDTVAPFQFALDAYEDAREPKELKMLSGGHFDAYGGPGFEECASAARDHFVKHLRA